MANPRPSTNRSGTGDPLLKYKIRRKHSKCHRRGCIISAAVPAITLLLLLTFFAVFVGIPVVFRYSPDLQRSWVFPISELWPPDPEFSNFERYGIQGARNLYISVNTVENVSLGVWHLLPKPLINSSAEENFNYTSSLAQSEYPVVMHFHGNGGNRVKYKDMYEVLRGFFHVIAFDYRGYGDSTPATPTEDDIMEDCIQLYKWVQSQTSSDIYLWGHSLGSALSTRTAAKLSLEDSEPVGLFLEAPFTTMRDEVQYAVRLIPYSDMFSWLPWYEATVIDAFEANGFCFKTVEHILTVDCPVMIIHARDDQNIPYYLGEKLFITAQENRNLTTQGNVTFHLLPAEFGHSHWGIYNATELPNYIRDHIVTCTAFRKESIK